MKKSVIIGKRQIVLAVLVVALGVAVYLNWRFASVDGGLDLTAGVSTSSKYLGDATYVNNSAETGSVDAASTESSGIDTSNIDRSRESRDKARKESQEMLKEIINDAKSDDESKKAATDSQTQIALDVEKEGLIESLVRAKGFNDCVAIISNGQANIIVQTEGLIEAQTLQIQDIVVSQTNLSLDNIKIHEVK